MTIKTKLSAIAALLLTIATGALAADKPTAHQIPLRMLGGYAVVEAKLDGYDRPLRLIVDTAASVSALDSKLAEQLNMVDSNARADSVQGASGAAHNVQFGKRTEFLLAGRRYELQPILTQMSHFSRGGADPGSYHGILGNDLLQQYDIRFDVPAGVLELVEAAPNGLQFAGRQCQSNGFSADRPHYLKGFGKIDVGASSDGRHSSIEALIDTGAAQTLFNWAAIQTLGYKRGDDRLRERAQGTSGFGHQRIETHLAVLDELSYGTWNTPELEVRVTDLPVLKAIGMDQGPAVILGIDVLQQLPLTISKGVTHICMG